MGKKKEKKAPKQKDKSRVDERIKQINNAQPLENPHKLDDEKNVDRFFKFGVMRRGIPLRMREENRLKKKERRYSVGVKGISKVRNAGKKRY